MPDPLWDKLLSQHGLDEAYINQRYDLIVHLVTAADGCEQFYTTQNNTARKETAEEVRLVLHKCVTCVYVIGRFLECQSGFIN